MTDSDQLASLRNDVFQLRVDTRDLRSDMRWVKWLLVVVILLFGKLVLGATRTSTPRDAVADAVADAAKLPIDAQPFTRYFWLQSGTPTELAAFQYTLNAALSSAQSIQYSRIVNANLVAVDLRAILPEHADFVRVLDVLENHIDPYFHVVQRLQVIEIGQFVVVVNRVAIWKSGTKTIGTLPQGTTGTVTGKNGSWVQIRIDGRHGWVDAKEIAVVSFGLHVLPRPEIDTPPRIVDANLLGTLTQSRCPIFTFPHFQTLALSQVDGGFYYDLIGVKTGQPLAEALAVFGIDEKQFNNPAATNRVARFVSFVANAHPRAGKFGNNPGIRPTDGPSIWTATEDIADEDLNVGQHAIYNLRGAEFRFTEIITARQNGMLAGLVAADGKLADVVEDEVAHDTHNRPPHTGKINGWFTCFRCHAKGGFQDFPNDVQLMADANGGELPVFADLSLSPEEQLAVRDELKAQYLGDMDTVLAEARRGHARQVFMATGLPYEKVYEAVVSTYENYEYDWVQPDDAARWLGYEVAEADGPKMFGELVPKLPVNIFGFSPDDPTIIGLRSWKSVSKRPEIRIRDWEKVFGDAALRSLAYKPEAK